MRESSLVPRVQNNEPASSPRAEYDGHNFIMFKWICTNTPQSLVLTSRTYLRDLLEVDPKYRLGSRGKRGGSRDVMSHPWFTGVDWKSIAKVQLRLSFVSLPAPEIPHRIPHHVCIQTNFQYSTHRRRRDSDKEPIREFPRF